MRTSTIVLYTLVGFMALCHVGFSNPIIKRQVLNDPGYLNPAEQDLEANEDTDRDKRKVEGAIDLKYGAKNVVLGLIFNHSYHFLLKPKFLWRHKRQVDKTPPPKQETTTEDIVLFTPGQRVSLEVPDQLFGSGYTLITNLSEVVGSLIQNSAERTARIFEAMKPFLQGVFGVKSITITRDGAKDNAI